jgi:hypothetical protein
MGGITGDLEHRDWLLFSTEQILLTVDVNIRTKIIDTEDGGKRLIISHISEAAIDELIFLTNTDKNNNYGYIELLNVYVNGESNPTVIKGFNDVVLSMFRRSDITAFLQDKKLHKPFNVENLINGSDFKGSSFSEYVDIYAGLVQGPDTKNKVKVYEVIFNPDYIDTFKWTSKYNGVFYVPTLSHYIREYTKYDVDKLLQEKYGDNQTIKDRILINWSDPTSRNTNPEYYDRLYRNLIYAYNILKIDPSKKSYYQFDLPKYFSAFTLKNQLPEEYEAWRKDNIYAKGSTLPRANIFKSTNNDY